MRYDCDQCDYKATRPYHLRTHQNSFHEGVKRYSCDQCDYAATKQAYLRTHQQSEHSYKTELSEQTQQRKTHTNCDFNQFDQIVSVNCRRKYITNLNISLKSRMLRGKLFLVSQHSIEPYSKRGS